MLWELYTAALGMLPQQTKLEILSNNIANISTVGFKGIGSFQHALIEAQKNLRNVPGQAEAEDIELGKYINFQQGSIVKTGNPLDLTIDGNGFFLVADNDGMQYLTRAGQFTLDSEGYLRTLDGKYVIGSSGPILLRETLAGSDGEEHANLQSIIRINQNGEIYIGNRYIDTLSIIQVENPQSLEHIGASHLKPTVETQFTIRDESQYRILQGYLEQSNVSLVDEMVNLIALQRLYELGQKTIRTNDETLSRSIDIGRFF